MDLNLSDLVPNETVVENIHDGTRVLVTGVGRNNFLAIYDGEAGECLCSPRHWRVVTPPLIDPAAVYVIVPGFRELFLNTPEARWASGAKFIHITDCEEAAMNWESS